MYTTTEEYVYTASEEYKIDMLPVSLNARLKLYYFNDCQKFIYLL